MEVTRLLIALLVPGALAAPYVGKLVDEHDAAHVLVFASLLQAVTVSYLFVFTTEEASLAGAALLSVLFAVSGIATFALIPIVGGLSKLSPARANAMVELALGGGAVCGPIVA